MEAKKTHFQSIKSLNGKDIFESSYQESLLKKEFENKQKTKKSGEEANPPERINCFNKPSNKLQILNKETQNFLEKPLRFERKALEVLHLFTEEKLVRVFEDGNFCALHANRVTLMAKDLHLLARLKGKFM